MFDSFLPSTHNLFIARITVSLSPVQALEKRQRLPQRWNTLSTARVLILQISWLYRSQVRLWTNCVNELIKSCRFLAL